MQQTWYILKKSYYLMIPRATGIIRATNKPMMLVHFHNDFHNGIGVAWSIEHELLTLHEDEECDNQVFLYDKDLYLATDFFIDPLNPTQVELQTFKMISGHLLANWEEA